MYFFFLEMSSFSLHSSPIKYLPMLPMFFFIQSHLSAIRVIHTCWSHWSLTLVSHTCQPYLPAIPVSYTFSHICQSYLSAAPVSHTCQSHLSVTPVSGTTQLFLWKCDPPWPGSSSGWNTPANSLVGKNTREVNL